MTMLRNTSLGGKLFHRKVPFHASPARHPPPHSHYNPPPDSDLSVDYKHSTRHSSKSDSSRCRQLLLNQAPQNPNFLSSQNNHTSTPSQSISMGNGGFQKIEWPKTQLFYNPDPNFQSNAILIPKPTQPFINKSQRNTKSPAVVGASTNPFYLKGTCGRTSSGSSVRKPSN